MKEALEKERDVGNFEESYSDFEARIFTPIALFEAEANEYWKSSSLRIDDKYFNSALETMNVLDTMPIPVQTIDLITVYYRGMDYLLADKFHRSHHRKDKWVRIGPFSVSDGSYWNEIVRPGLSLSANQRQEFVANIWERLSGFGQIYHPTLRNIVEQIGGTPVAVTGYYGVVK